MIKITIVIFINPCSWMNSTMYKHGPKIAFLGCKQYAEVFGNAYCPKQNSWVSYIFIHFRVCRQLKWKRRQSSESATQKSSVIYFYSECIEKNDTVNNYTLIINYIGISWILIGFIASVFFFSLYFLLSYTICSYFTITGWCTFPLCQKRRVTECDGFSKLLYSEKIIRITYPSPLILRVI